MIERALPSRTHSANMADTLLSVIVVGILGVSVFLSINAVKVGLAGVPMRALLGPLALGITLLLRPALLFDTVAALRRPLMVVLAFLALGIFVSLMARNPVPVLIQQIVEIHIQAIIGLLVAGVALRLSSPGVVAMVFLCSFAFSGSMGLLQFANVDIGWRARAFVGGITGDPLVTQSFYTLRYRALGMAFNPVVLGTQATVAFAAFFGYRMWATEGGITRQFDWQVLVAMIVCAMVCVASGNRSPLLGFALFFTIYVAVVMPRLLLVVFPLVIVGMAAIGGLLEYLQSLGLRVAETNDSSAEGRATLAAYGLALVQDRPLGYGLTFNSIPLWPRYAHLVLYMENPNVIRSYTLHNYFMLMLTKYGIGALLLAPLALPLRRKTWWAVLGFVPYVGHIAFHNEGPLQSDFLIWYILPIFLPAIAMLERMRPEGRRLGAPGSWRSTPRMAA